MREFFIVACCGVVCLAVAAGCSTPPVAQDPKTFNAEAFKLMDEAEKIMFVVGLGSDVVVKTPELYDLKQYLPEARRLRLNEALLKLYDAYKLEPKWGRLNMSICKCEVAMGNYDKGVEFGKSALRYDGTLYEAHLLIACAFTKKGEEAQNRRDRNRSYSEAVKSYNRFIKARPEHFAVPTFQQNIAQLQAEMDKP